MHDIEPHYLWDNLYSATEDPRGPFFGNTYNELEYETTIYGYYIHPQWDYIGSETLYVKLLYVDYDKQYAIIELFGEWNDTLNNDIMFLKREIADVLIAEGIKKFILLGEHVFNFHGHEDDYYAEWFDDIEEGWLVALDFRDFVLTEIERCNLDSYINFGGDLEVENWRTLHPFQLFSKVDKVVTKRLN